MKRRIVLTAGLAILIAASSPGNADMTVADRLAPGQPTVVIAHRSAILGDAPENTLPWIAAAIDRGVDAVHINPQRTADGQYVLMHDNTLNRTTDVETVFPEGPAGGPSRDAQGGRDYVGYYTLDEIRQLHILGALDVTVPTLGEALDQADGRLIVVLGLKSYEVPTLAAELSGRDTSNLLLFDLYYTGTDQRKLADLAAATGIGVHCALYGSQDYLKDLNALHDQLGPALQGVHVKSRGLTPAFQARMKELGLRLYLSGWSGGEDYALIDKGDPGPWQAALQIADGALTDQPDGVLRLLGR